MNYRNIFQFTLSLLGIFALVFFTGCKVGEDDPAISFRSRDNRLKANWKLDKMNNRYEIRTFQAGTLPVVTVITSNFDGYDMHVRTEVNSMLVSDSTFGMSYLLKVKDDGKLLYENAFIQFGFSVKSSGADSWYWLNDDSKKARVFVGNALQSPMAAGVQAFPGGVNVNLGNLATDFRIDRLKAKELNLSYDKTTNQASLNGSFQQLIISSKLTFSSK